MKNFKIYLAYVASLAMVFTSCSKEDNPDSPDGPAGDEMAVLGFNAMLQDFNRQMLTKQQEPDLGSINNGLPVCSDEPNPDRVRVMLERDVDGVWVPVEDPSDGDYKIEVPVRYDSNSETWITDEGDDDELELEEGTYRIAYFAVMEGENKIYIAPRENDDYGPAAYENFVSDALPSEPFLLQKGVKKYIDVEVLCYDDHYVYRYGYLFFDFEEVDILYLCLFGNVCDEDGRHTPAKFRFDVWNYSGSTLDPKGSILYSDTNSWGTYENGDAYAEPLCVQLPDRPGETDQYYGELWLVDDDGNIINEGDGPIRLGVFDEEDVANQTWAGYEVDETNGDSTSNYYHFREGDCMNQDDSDPCLFKDIAYYENGFNDGETFLNNGVETGTDYIFSDTAGWTPGDTPDSDAPLWVEGTYSFTSNPNDVHNSWIDFDNGNDFFILNGDITAGTGAYFAITQPDVCPEADYFVAFDILNVYDGSASPDNDIRLIAEVNGTPLNDTDQIIVVPYNGSNWTRVALRVKANGSGELDIKFVDDNTVASGNDFALDNVVISNDPSITSPNDIEVVQD